MSIEELIASLRARGHSVDVSGPASPDALRKIELEIRHPLPASYRSFLEVQGTLSIYDNHVSGVWNGSDVDGGAGTVLWDTDVLKSDGGFPDGFIVVGIHEDGAHCLDFNRQRPDGECPVVNFERGSIQHEIPVAATFEEWLVEFRLKPWMEEPP
jgi:SMI1-KNR4 cell-wall